MSNENKIESYRIMADSLILSTKSKDISTTTINNNEGSPGTPHTPTWDINSLEHESEDLMARASVRLKKLKSSYGKNAIFRWIKNWRNLRKAVEITTELDQLVPKLKSTEEELNIWLEVLRSQKSSSLSQGMNLISELEKSVVDCERNMDLFDELHNDCLQVNFDVSNMSTYLFNALTFNIEVLRELKEPRKRSGSKSTISPTHGLGHGNYPHGISHNYAHGHSHSQGHGLHRHHNGKASKQSNKSSSSSGKQSSHTHTHTNTHTATNTHRSPLLNGFNATISHTTSEDEGSPLTLENLKRLEWELRVSPGTERTVIKSPTLLLPLALTASQRGDDNAVLSAETQQVIMADVGGTDRQIEETEVIEEDTTSIIKSEGVFELLESSSSSNILFSDSGGSDNENDHDHDHHDDDDLVFDIVSNDPLTKLTPSPAVLPALGVPVAATVSRDRRLSFEEIMEPAVWQGFSTHNHRGIVAHSRPSLSGLRYSRGQTKNHVYGAADGLILTKKHSSLSAIEAYSQITAMTNGGSSNGGSVSMTDHTKNSNDSNDTNGSSNSSNLSLGPINNDTKVDSSGEQSKVTAALPPSAPLLAPLPLARASSLTYSPSESSAIADRVQVKSKSLSMSAIDFSIQYTTMNFTPTPESSFIVSSEPTVDSKLLTLSESGDHLPNIPSLC